MTAAAPPARARSTRIAPAPPAPAVPLLQRPLTSYYLLLGSTGLLVALGLVMVFSASSVISYASSGSSFTFFVKQGIWVVLGVPCMWVAMRLPVSFYRRIAYPALALSVAGLLLVLAVGTTVSGATSWIRVGPLSFQPSEPVKLALALWGADVLVRKRALLGEWKHLLVPLLPGAGLLAFLIMMQPDLGTTITLSLVLLGLLWFVGAPVRIFVAMGGLGVAAVAALTVAEPYRMARITGFLDPFADPLDSGYQTVQAIYAISSGGLTGVGLGASREKWSYLPNPHTDFVYAIIGEELGLLGALLVLVLFAGLTVAGVRIASRATDPFARLVAGAVTVWIVGQAILNMCTVIGLLPITGVPLPLVSFGGTALLVALVALGVLASFARTEPGAAEALAQRPPGPVS
ncbi:MAG: putative lipid II flippase FtsW, partial [Actinomycetota bacterium]|nr:putative lipid II flippase FtsW [Actinomycetota bacterium]